MTTDDRGEHERLVRIEVKVDQILVQDKDHETRIRKLERAMWLWAGAAGGLGGLVGSLIGSITGSGP